jgi:hypothetical protein
MSNNKITVSGITYTGCNNSKDGNWYYMKTSSGTVITADADLKGSNWDSATRYITFKYSSGNDITWHAGSNGSGATGTVAKDKTYYLCYYRDGANHPFCLSTGNKNSSSATGWITKAEFERGCPTLKLRYYPNGGSQTSDQSKSYALGTGGYHERRYSTNLVNVSNIFTPPSGYTAAGGTSDYRVGSNISTTYADHDTGAFTTKKTYANWSSSTSNRYINLYANWKKNIVLTYYDNGGHGGPGARPAVTIYYPSGYEFTINDDTPTRTGYNFVNWNTAANGSGTSYTAGKKVTKTSSWSLYAQWEAHDYTVTYLGNGATSGSTA